MKTNNMKNNSFFSRKIIACFVMIAAVFIFAGVVSAQGIGLKSQTTGETANPVVQAGTTTATGSQIINLLRNISTITLDNTLFKNPAFLLLSNQGVGLPAPSSQGRINPFSVQSAGSVPVF